MTAYTTVAINVEFTKIVQNPLNVDAERVMGDSVKRLPQLFASIYLFISRICIIEVESR